MVFTFGPLGPRFSGLLAYGIREMDGVQGKEGRRCIFLLEGLVTVAISFLVFWLVPDFPEQTKFLTVAENEQLLETLQLDKGDQKIDVQGTNWVKAIFDYKIMFP
ncbi:hypothetical protein MBLNU13_g11258t1 [Cladosporium sp. NU13]